MPRRSSATRRTAEIAKLRREVADIQSMLHNAQSANLEDQIQALEGMREDAVRALVLHVSLAVETVLDDLIRIGFLGHEPRSTKRRRSKQERVIDELLGALFFDKKLQLARAARIIGKRHFDELNELRRVRNACAHRWMLDGVVKKGSRRRPTRRTLEYRNRNLFDPSVLKRFRADYGRVYLSLFGKLVSSWNE